MQDVQLQVTVAELLLLLPRSKHHHEFRVARIEYYRGPHKIAHDDSRLVV